MFHLSLLTRKRLNPAFLLSIRSLWVIHCIRNRFLPSRFHLLCFPSVFAFSHLSIVIPSLSDNASREIRPSNAKSLSWVVRVWEAIGYRDSFLSEQRLSALDHSQWRKRVLWRYLSPVVSLGWSGGGPQQHRRTLGELMSHYFLVLSICCVCMVCCWNMHFCYWEPQLSVLSSVNRWSFLFSHPSLFEVLLFSKCVISCVRQRVGRYESQCSWMDLIQFWVLRSYLR